jgi:hypothetical protein
LDLIVSYRKGSRMPLTNCPSSNVSALKDTVEETHDKVDTVKEQVQYVYDHTS